MATKRKSMSRTSRGLLKRREIDPPSQRYGAAGIEEANSVQKSRRHNTFIIWRWSRRRTGKMKSLLAAKAQTWPR